MLENVKARRVAILRAKREDCLQGKSLEGRRATRSWFQGLKGAHPGRGNIYEQTPGTQLGHCSPGKSLTSLNPIRSPPGSLPFPLPCPALGLWASGHLGQCVIDCDLPVQCLAPGRHTLNVRSTNEALNE